MTGFAVLFKIVGRAAVSIIGVAGPMSLREFESDLARLSNEYDLVIDRSHGNRFMVSDGRRTYFVEFCQFSETLGDLIGY